MSTSKKRKLNELEGPLTYQIEDHSQVKKRGGDLSTNIKTSSGFLSEYNIYLHPASLSKTRKTLFENQVLSNGGKLISDLSSFRNVEKPVILIDDNLIDKKRISQMIEKIENSKSSEGKW